jgi:hypothetical protein
MKNKIKLMIALIAVCGSLAACQFFSSEKPNASSNGIELKDTTIAPVDSTATQTLQDSAMRQ